MLKWHSNILIFRSGPKKATKTKPTLRSLKRLFCPENNQMKFMANLKKNKRNIEEDKRWRLPCPFTDAFLGSQRILFVRWAADLSHCRETWLNNFMGPLFLFACFTWMVRILKALIKCFSAGAWSVTLAHIVSPKRKILKFRIYRVSRFENVLRYWNGAEKGLPKYISFN